MIPSTKLTLLKELEEKRGGRKEEKRGRRERGEERGDRTGEEREDIYFSPIEFTTSGENKLQTGNSI